MPHSIQREHPKPNQQPNRDPPQVMLVPKVPEQHQLAVVAVALAHANWHGREVQGGVEGHAGVLDGVQCERALERVREQRLQRILHGLVHDAHRALGPILGVHLHPALNHTTEIHGPRHALHGGVHRVPGGQRECGRVVGADSGDDAVEVLKMHEPRDGGPRATPHVAGCIDGEEATTTGRIDDGVERNRRLCEVECRGAGDNSLLRRGFGEDTKCSVAVGDGWGGEYLPRERGGPEHGELVHFR